MNYTLVAYSPWEGLEIKFHGTKGELTHRHVEVHGIFGGKRDAGREESITTELHLAGSQSQEIGVWRGEGEHGGGDRVMLGHIFDKANTPARQIWPRRQRSHGRLVDPHRHRRQRLHRQRRRSSTSTGFSRTTASIWPGRRRGRESRQSPLPERRFLPHPSTDATS